MPVICERTNTSSFGIGDKCPGRGVVGENLLNAEPQETRYADIAIDLLNGEPIDDEGLPSGSIVRNRDLSNWGLQRRTIVGVAILLILPILLIFGLLLHRIRCRQIESALKDAQGDLEERLQFERVLSDISERFIDVGTASVESEIASSLRQITSFLDLDHCTLFKHSEDRSQILATHVCAKAGVRPPADTLPIELFPWTTTKILEGDMLVFTDPADLPDEAALERRYFEKEGISAGILVPLMISDSTPGVIAFTKLHSPQQWPTLIIERLRLVAEIFSNALMRKQAQLEAQRHRAELAHVARVASLGELSASLAHELGQPLTAILSNAQAARRFLSGSSADLQEVRGILEDIIEDDRRAGYIIHRLRNLMSGGEQKLTALDINELIQAVVELTRGDAIAKHVSLVLELASGLPPVMGDTIHVQQVVLNLILNGTDAMAEIEPQFRKLIISTSQPDSGAVMVSVRDMGTGVDEQNLEDIFDAFHTTKPEGMGMGLSICRSIIKSHGGRLWAENNLDRGATFSFTLPTIQGSPESISAPLAHPPHLR